MQPKVYISCSRGALGSVFSLFYFEHGKDIYGWHIEARNLYFSAAFFMLENFYATQSMHLYRSVEDDVYGPWIIDYPPAKEEIRSPVPEEVEHELERLQSMFVEEWLFFKNDDHIEAELAAYLAHKLPVHEVNIKSRRLHRLQQHGRDWVYATPGIDRNVVQLLRKYWRLSEKLPMR